MKRIVSIVSLTVLLVVGSEAISAVRVYTFSLSGAQEVPANASTATGTCTVKLDDATGSVDVTGSYQGLSVAASAAHIHGLAEPGFPAGVILPLNHTGGAAGNLSGTGTLNAANVQGMIDGKTYVNVHTANFPGGEIRGQIVNTVPAPMLHLWVMALLMMVLLGAGCILLLRRRSATV